MGWLIFGLAMWAAVYLAMLVLIAAVPTMNEQMRAETAGNAILVSGLIALVVIALVVSVWDVTVWLAVLVF